MKEKIKILIADDHPAVRYGIRSVLQLEPNLDVVGEVSNGDDALDFLAKKQVDFVIVDLKMPGKDGFETVKNIRIAYPKIKILAFSIYDEQYRVMNMLKAGADGYLLKSVDNNEIVKAISMIMKGEKYISKEVADKVIFNVISSETALSDESKLKMLSRREIEVLILLTEDNSYSEIADKLNISKRTVDTHRYNIAKKLEKKNLAGLIRFAINQGLA